MSRDQRATQLSTAEAVGAVIRRNYVLYEALRMKVVNYHALAARAGPRVEELTGKKTKLPTLVVAIKRFSDGIAEERATELEKILDDARVTLTGDVAEISFRASGVPPTRILEDVLKMVPRLTTLPEIMQLPGVVKVLVDREDSKLIEKEMGRRYRMTVERGMAKIGVRISPRSERTVGLATFITELLFRNGVVLQGAYIGRPDSLLVLEERFGARAYDILRERVAAH